MAKWPPQLPPTGRTDDTVSAGNHPGDHNLAAAALAAIAPASVPAFANVGDRDSAAVGYVNPPNGALCVTLDTNTVWQRVAGVWQPLVNGAITVQGTTFGGAFTAAQVQIGSLTIAAANAQRKALIAAQVHESTPGPTTQFQCNVKLNGADLAIGKAYFGSSFLLGPRLVTLAASTPYTVTVHALTTWGSGSANVPSDANFNYLSALIFN
jgi:hypothetical protein